jgi:hypothetical protein
MFAGCLAVLAGCICWLPKLAGLVVSGGWLSLAILIGNYGFADLFSLCWHVSWLYFLRGYAVYAH